MYLCFRSCRRFVVFDDAKLDGLQALNKSCSKVFMQVQNVFTQMYFFM